MNNEELKKKICKIIAPYVSAWGDDERIADALIAAWLGDMKDAEHRAEVVERALRVLARKFVIFAFPNGDWKELIEQLVSEIKEQAEKQLAEEGK